MVNEALVTRPQSDFSSCVLVIWIKFSGVFPCPKITSGKPVLRLR